jgi:hypothetical protein
MNYVGEARKLADEIAAKANAIIDDAGGQVASTIVLFRQQVFDTATKEAHALVADIDGRINKLLDDTRCVVNGAQQGAAQWLRQQVHWLGGGSDECWAENGARWFAPRSNEYLRIFRIRECELRRSMSGAATVRALLDGYSTLTAWARYIRCISGTTEGSAGSLPFEEVEEETNRAYSVWSFVSTPSFRSNKGRAKLRFLVALAAILVVSSGVARAECTANSSPQSCYTEGMQQIISALAQMKEFAAAQDNRSKELVDRIEKLRTEMAALSASIASNICHFEWLPGLWCADNGFKDLRTLQGNILIDSTQAFPTGTPPPPPS